MRRGHPNERPRSPRTGRRRRALVAGSLALLGGLLTGTTGAPQVGADGGEPILDVVIPDAVTPRGGTLLHLTGANLSGASSLVIGSTILTAEQFAVLSDSEIVVPAPPAAAVGTAAITVHTASGANLSSPAFRYQAPTVTDVNPSWAPLGTASTITLTGTGFDGVSAADVSVAGATPTVVYSVSDTELVVTLPAVTTATAGHVAVMANTTPSPSAPGNSFAFTAGPPTVTGLNVHDSDPGTGVAPGSSLIVTGTNFVGVPEVRFGPTLGSDVQVSPAGTSLVVKVPARPIGEIDLTVTTPAGTSATGPNSRFTYKVSTEPTITGVVPATLDRTVGGTFLVTGSNLGALAPGAVKLGGTAVAAITVVTDSLIIVTALGNSGVTASVDLTVTGPLTEVTRAAAIRYE